MSEFTVSIGIPPGDISGATQAASALNRVEEAAKPTKLSVEEMNRILNQAQSEKFSGALDGAGKSAKLLKDGAEVAAGSLRPLPGMLRDLAEGYGELSGLLAQGGLVAAAAAAGFKAGAVLGDSIIDVLSEKYRIMEEQWNDRLDRIESDAAKRKFRFSGLDEEVDRVEKRLNSLQAAMDALRTAEAGSLKATTAADTAEMQAGAAAQMASAKTDAERNAIKVQTEMAVEIKRAEAEITQLANAAKNLREKYQDASEAARLANEAFEKKREELQIVMRGDDPTAAVRARDELKRIEDQRAQRNMGVDAIGEQVKAADAAERQRRSEFEAKRTELDSQAKDVARELRSAIELAVQNAVAAKSDLASAQSTGNVSEQTKAYSSFSSAQQDVNRLVEALRRMGQESTVANDAVIRGFDSIAKQSTVHSEKVIEQAQVASAEIARNGDLNVKSFQQIAAAQLETNRKMDVVFALLSSVSAAAERAETKAGNVANQLRIR